MGQSSIRTDAILRPTRIVAAIIIPFLLAAFVILYFMSTESGQLFAWQINPPMTAALMGAGYLSGAYFFSRVLFERYWHRVHAGYIPVAIFTLIMLVTTLLHWEIFVISHWPFQVWLGLYILTPVIVPLVWWYNRRTDPGTPENSKDQVPQWIRRALFLIGLIQMVFALVLMLFPQAGIAIWPWTVTPLTNRVLAGWLIFLAVGALALGSEARWSSWPIPLQSILIWQVLVVVAGIFHRPDFENSVLLNWFTFYTMVGIIGALALYLNLSRLTRSE
jgi:hypothetical protein